MSEKTDIKSMNLEELKTLFFRYGGESVSCKAGI